MSDYLSNLDLIWNFLVTVLTTVFNLFTSHPIFMSVFGLWILDRIFGIFDLIRG